SVDDVPEDLDDELLALLGLPVQPRAGDAALGEEALEQPGSLRRIDVDVAGQVHREELFGAVVAEQPDERRVDIVEPARYVGAKPPDRRAIEPLVQLAITARHAAG